MKRAFRIYDPILFALTALATIVGMFFIYDAGYPQAMMNSKTAIPPEFRTQVLATVVAVFLGALASRISPQKWKRASWVIGVVVMLALIAVAKFGAERYGAKRWMVGIQPAEFAKLAAVMYLASIFADRKVWPKRIPRRANFAHWLDTIAVPKLARFLPAIYVCLAVYIIEKEPDLGTAAVIAVVGFLMFFPGNVTAKSLIAAVAISSVGMVAMVKGENYRMGRILNHSHRWDPDNADSTTFQTDTAELAVATGGLFGVGIGNGRAKHVMPAATTDFVMVTVGEETGLFGSLLVVGLLGAIAWRLYWHALQAKDRYSMLVLFGVASWIAVQTCVNVMMANAFLPAIGVPLPFISSGGSSLVALWLALGVCQSALAPAHVHEENAVALSRNRWRHRRARLSRA